MSASVKFARLWAATRLPRLFSYLRRQVPRLVSRSGEIAWTDPNGAFPGFVCAKQHEPGVIRLTVRERGSSLVVGRTVELLIPQADFRRLINSAKDAFRGK